eukprot:1157825-Pelagomonas_calceolata.AAC.2
MIVYHRKTVLMCIVRTCTVRHTSQALQSAHRSAAAAQSPCHGSGCTMCVMGACTADLRPTPLNTFQIHNSKLKPLNPAPRSGTIAQHACRGRCCTMCAMEPRSCSCAWGCVEQHAWMAG